VTVNSSGTRLFVSSLGLCGEEKCLKNDSLLLMKHRKMHLGARVCTAVPAPPVNGITPHPGGQGGVMKGHSYGRA